MISGTKTSIKDFITYLIINKGFVVVDKTLYRCIWDDGKKIAVTYHEEDIGYKWERYTGQKLQQDTLLALLHGIDIVFRKPEEKAFIRSLINK